MPEHPPAESPMNPTTLLPVQIAIGLATVPVLGLLVGSRLVAAGLQTVGDWSEELWRGDRLPSLTPPTAPPPNT